VAYCCPCGVGQATCSEGSLDIASNSGLEGNRVTDLCGTARLGGQVCPRKVWLHVQTVSCDDGRLDPAQDRDLSERKRLCSTHGPANGSWLFGVGISCGRLRGRRVESRSHRHNVKIGRTRVWQTRTLVGQTRILITPDSS